MPALTFPAKLPKLTLTPRRKLALMIVGYAAFFVVCFVVSAYFTFPYDRVRDLLIKKVAMLAPPGQPAAKLSIEELGPYRLSGIALTGVQYEKKGATDADPVTKLALDELTVRASLLGLLRSRADVSFGASVGDGDASGEYQTAEGEPTRLQAELDELDVGKLGLGTLLGLPLTGTATGTIDVTLGDKPAETQGSIDLQMSGVRIGDGKAKIKLPGMPGGLTLDAIDAGELELEVAIRDGIASIEKLEGKGKDLQMSGSGSVRMDKSVGASRADLTLGVKFDDGYTKKSERTKAAFDLMSGNPLIKRATSADGTIRFRLTGPLSALRAAPGAGAGGAARSRKRKGEEG